MAIAKKQTVTPGNIPPVYTGRRKCAIARVRIAPGTGEIKVNGRPHNEFSTRLSDIARMEAPLRTAGVLGSVNVYATTVGGGIAGQCDAIRMGLSRALMAQNPDFRPSLKKEGLVTRDPRVKERKKYGRKRARKRFQYSKR